MKYQEFKKKVIDNLEKYKLETLGCEEKGIHENKEYGHILPKKLKSLNFIKGVTPPKDIHYHIYAHHLNSSQSMCINFFQPIMKNNLLLSLLRETIDIDIPKEATIIKSNLEYKDPNGKDDTKFDFYLELSTGEKIYFEVKYTENGFGKVSKSNETNVFPQKYEEKYTNVYKAQLEESLHLKGLSKDELYKHYQINRDISYIKSLKEYVVFLYPFDNESLVNELKEVPQYGNTYSLDWGVLASKALEESKDTELHRVYKEFYDKYLSY